MKSMTKILNTIYILIVLLFLLDILPSFDIKSQSIKSLVYYGLIIGTPLTLIWNLIILKTRKRKILWSILPTVLLIFILIVGPMKFIFSIGAWRTQTVLFQNGHLKFKTVEIQKQDVGAFGYNRRTVEVIYLTPFFIITREVPKDIDKRVEWIRVDNKLNELELIPNLEKK